MSIPLLGEWRQLRPDPHPASIVIAFESDGRLRYTLVTTTTQQVLLHWRVEGDLLITRPPGAPREERKPFRFDSPSRLVVDFGGESFVYERVGGSSES